MINQSTYINLDGRQVRIINEQDGINQTSAQKQHVFIIGSKGIPANYGGFETFVERLTEYKVSDKIQYHVARLGEKKFEFEYNSAICFNLHIPNIGPAKAVYYDIEALEYSIKYCETHSFIKNPIFYILACRIGPFLKYYKKRINDLNGRIYVNPDGHEWMRKKWSPPIRKYWKYSEKLMVKHSDLLICDSKNIENYILSEYECYQPKTIFIAYGAEISTGKLSEDYSVLEDWFQKKCLKKKSYYLVVGRFVPENNYEIMIKEFMSSKTSKDLVIISTTNNNLLDSLEKKLHFRNDSRVKFVGTVYNQELLKEIRANAFGYIHGHEVGGTNPSLLESLSYTDLNLLLNVGFNREVAEDSAKYWNKNIGSLAKLIETCDDLKQEDINDIGTKAKKRIRNEYSWELIVNLYENLFLNNKGDDNLGK